MKHSDSDLARVAGALCSFVLTLMLTGCGTTGVYQAYEGPTRPVDQIARLRVPHTIDVLAIDGDASKWYRPNIASDMTELHVLPGRHEIEVRYAEIWESDYDNHKTVRSAPVTLDVSAEAGQVFEIALTRPKDLEAAIAFSQKPEITLHEAAVALDRPASEPKEPERNVLNELRVRAQGDTLIPSPAPRPKGPGPAQDDTAAPDASPAPVEPAPAPDPPADAPEQTTPARVTPAPSESAPAEVPKVPILKHWWEQASEEERRQFLDSIQEK